MKQHLIISILSYFIIYSFMGWFLETVFKTIEEKKYINSGFLFGPLCPIYGIGALIMIFCLGWFKDKYILLFLVSIIVLSTWEYIVGVCLEKIFKAKYWDYSDKKFNIKGRVCLLNSIYWGILAVLFIQFIHPFINEQLNIIPNNILIYLNILIYMYFIADSIVTIIKLNNINIRFNKLRELSEAIKQKAEELELNLENFELKNIIDELKERREELRNTLQIKTRRIRTVFPTMKSENISEFLMGRVERIKKNTEKIKKRIKDI